jgi:hypothetical protein
MSASPNFDYLEKKSNPELSIPYTQPHSDLESLVDIPFLSDDELSQDFEFCVPDIPSVKVFLAIYKINGTCYIETTPMPFLKYMVEIGETATFPSFDFECSSMEEEKFKTELVMFLMQVLNIEDDSGDLYERAFRGMVFNPDHKCLFIMIDYAKCNAPPTNTETWAIVDELVFERRVWNLPVDIPVSDTFRKNEILWTLPNTEIPVSLYMIKEDQNGIYSTDLSPNTESPTLFMHGDTIDTYKYADEYGDMYIFTQNPLLDDGTGSDRKYARYAVFTPGAKYLLEDQYHHDYLQSLHIISNTNKDVNANDAVSTIYFVEDKITKLPTQLWGMKDSSRFVRI